MIILGECMSDWTIGRKVDTSLLDPDFSVATNSCNVNNSTQQIMRVGMATNASPASLGLSQVLLRSVEISVRIITFQGPT